MRRYTKPIGCPIREREIPPRNQSDPLLSPPGEVHHHTNPSNLRTRSNNLTDVTLICAI
ncbi:hypothetical protein JAAARDRAFT_679822 [Jaapia argillacea MUCL 33604]|uniref:Uncharacterized protein n=1 Tax=Jaapia argillacea MUCL 33604 TaxID=933084 RepID=A0A067Q848_9AGAM|nr:hypothetical protein JAAARDRAFT_679822 [Jaapia argillacea MUCL 33604]